MKRYAFFFLLALVVGQAYCQTSDLYPYALQARLDLRQDTVSRQDVWHMQWSLINTSDRRVRVITPFRQCSGERLVYLVYYTVDSTHFYREVYRESRSIDIDSTDYCMTSSRYIEPQDTLSFPLLVGDTPNYHRHIQSHHRRPDLPAGTYHVRAFYQPLDDPMAAYFMVGMPAVEGEIPAPDAVIVPREGTVTPPVALTITDTPHHRQPVASCGADCKLCRAIADSHWGKVRRIIDQQTRIPAHKSRHSSIAHWTAPHRRIAWVFPGPEAILASLPSYTGRSVIFETDDGLAYYALSWRLGTVYPSRSRLRTVLSWMLQTDVRIRTSRVDTVRLTGFQPY